MQCIISIDVQKGTCVMPSSGEANEVKIRRNAFGFYKILKLYTKNSYDHWLAVEFPLFLLFSDGPSFKVKFYRVG